MMRYIAYQCSIETMTSPSLTVANSSKRTKRNRSSYWPSTLSLSSTLLLVNLQLKPAREYLYLLLKPVKYVVIFLRFGGLCADDKGLLVGLRVVVIVQEPAPVFWVVPLQVRLLLFIVRLLDNSVSIIHADMFEALKKGVTVFTQSRALGADSLLLMLLTHIDARNYILFYFLIINQRLLKFLSCQQS